MSEAILQLVLKGKLKDPFGPHFDEQKWKGACERIGTDDAHSLLETATIFKQYADAIQIALDKTVYKSESASSVTNSLIIGANGIALDFRSKHEAQIKQNNSNTLSVFPRVEMAGGNEFNIADANSSIIDALRLPLSVLINSLEKSEKFSTPNLIENHAEIDKIFALASSWHQLKILWQKCLYCGSRLVEFPDAFKLSDKFDFSYFVVGRSRQMHDNTAAFVARLYLKNQKKKKRKKAKKSTGRDFLNLVHFQQPSEKNDTPLDEFQRTFVLPSVVDATTSDLTYHELIDAFDALGDVVGETLDRFNVEQKRNLSAFLDIECRYSITSIVEAISIAVGISADEAKHAVNILTYGGERNFDPWATPLIDMEDGTVALIAGVLGPANRAFVLEALMKAQQFDLDARGDAFEIFLAKELTDAMASCRFSQIVKITDPGFILSINGQKEEIDLLLAIGRDLYVIECKCVLFPVEIPDEHFFSTRIAKAEAQLDRKIEFIEKHLEKLDSLHPTLNRFPRPNTVRGLIVTNFQAGSASFARYPITTPEFLVDYFTVGRSMVEFETRKEGVVTHDDAVVEHYDSFESFRINFWKCREIEPHILMFKKMLQTFENKMPFEELGLKQIIVRETEVVMSEDSQTRRGFLAAASEDLRLHLRK